MKIKPYPNILINKNKQVISKKLKDLYINIII